MSRIGKKPIQIPQGVEVRLEGRKLVVKGPKGELSREIPEVVDFKIENGLAVVSLKTNSSKNANLWGLGRALLAIMVKGVSEGFEKSLEFNGVGFKAQVKGDSLEMGLGYTHPVVINAPKGISFQIEKNVITVKGVDKEVVGQVAALIRASRLPEPYKGTGIKYKGEVILRKAGKKAATG